MHQPNCVMLAAGMNDGPEKSILVGLTCQKPAVAQLVLQHSVSSTNKGLAEQGDSSSTANRKDGRGNVEHVTGCNNDFAVSFVMQHHQYTDTCSTSE